MKPQGGILSLENTAQVSVSTLRHIIHLRGLTFACRAQQDRLFSSRRGRDFYF